MQFARGVNAREYIPIYANKIKEFSLNTVNKWTNLVKTYKVWDNETEVLVYGRFKRYLKGNVGKAWVQILADQHKWAEVNFELHAEPLTSKAMGPYTVEDQRN